jgi:hypothetical protein
MRSILKVHHNVNDSNSSKGLPKSDSAVNASQATAKCNVIELSAQYNCIRPRWDAYVRVRQEL